MDVSLIVETYNFGDEQGRDQLSGAIDAAMHAIDQHDDWELVVVDTCAAPGLDDRIAGRARRVDAAGLGYEEAKARAAAAASGRYIVYLDGDCAPVTADWAERLVAPLRKGHLAAAGTTRYSGGLVQATCSVLDFGFLFDAFGGGELGCYASNNVAFLRQAYLNEPVPQGPIRCRCFAHAQRLSRIGAPVQLVPEARVVHAPAPFLKERLRRGYDLVAACWVDPELEEARWLRLGIGAVPLFYGANLRLDWRRLAAVRRFYDWSALKTLAVAALLPISRLVDVVGILRALREGGATRGLSEQPGRP